MEQVNEHLGKYNPEEMKQSEEACAKLFSFLHEVCFDGAEYMHKNHYDLQKMAVVLSQLLEDSKMYIISKCPFLERYILDRIEVLNGAIGKSSSIYADAHKDCIDSLYTFKGFCEFIFKKLVEDDRNQWEICDSDIMDDFFNFENIHDVNPELAYRDKLQRKFTHGYRSILSDKERAQYAAKMAASESRIKSFDEFCKLNESVQNLNRLKSQLLRKYIEENGYYLEREDFQMFRDVEDSDIVELLDSVEEYESKYGPIDDGPWDDFPPLVFDNGKVLVFNQDTMKDKMDMYF